MEENNLPAKREPENHPAAKSGPENPSAAKRGGPKWNLTKEDVHNLKAMEENCPWKPKNGAGADKPNREIIQSTLPEKTSQEDNLDMDIDPSELEIGEDGNYYICLVCGDGGELICCDSGPCTFHMECLSPPFQNVGEGKWKCPRCSKRKKRSQAHNVSKRPKHSLAVGQSR